MKPLGDIIAARTKQLAAERKTERGELFRYFREQLNPGRVRDGYRPLSMGRLGQLLEKIPTNDLYYLQSVCDKAQNFSKRFWWEINPKNHGELRGKT